MIDFQARPNQRETILFGVALLIFFFGFIKACWVPSRHAITLVNEQLEELKTHSGTTAVLAGSPMLGAGFTGTANDLERLPERITSSLITQGIQLTGSRFSDLESSGGFMRQRVELSASGSFGALGRYLQALEEGRPPLVIDELSFTVTEGGAMALALKGSVYGQ